MMKIYIASSFDLVDRIKKVCEVLEDNGHEILVKWWVRLDLKKKFETLSVEEFYEKHENQVAYERDFNGVMNCDVLLIVADDEPRRFTGADIELGIALGNQKRCMSIGKLRKSAMYYPVYKAKDMDDVLETLELVEKWVYDSCE